MNFLAHLWLADRTRTSLAGSVLGDLVRGSNLSAYPDDIALGIRLHRRIDAATDRHPLMVTLREQFAKGSRRYAGIVLDLAADHALVSRWDALGPEPLAAFADRCGHAMAAAAPWFEKAGGRIPGATGFSQLLTSYGDAAGIERALARTSARLRDAQALIDASRDWLPLSQQLAPALEALFADLLAVAERDLVAATPSLP